MPSEDKCWICGADANSREHLIKASDLRAVFGNLNPEKPIFFSMGEIKNKPVHGLNADILKSTAGMCARCNNQRTQLHDLAWQKLSNALRTEYSPIVPGAIIRANRIFEIDTTVQMLNVHLFFVKQFGCRIRADSVPIDISSLSKAILENKSHPNIFIRFCQAAWALEGNLTGMSHVTALVPRGKFEGASFFYYLKDLAVSITYFENQDAWKGFPNSWHPAFSRNRIVLNNFLRTDGLPGPS